MFLPAQYWVGTPIEQIKLAYNYEIAENSSQQYFKGNMTLNEVISL
jgi:hypothetical protein